VQEGELLEIEKGFEELESYSSFYRTVYNTGERTINSYKILEHIGKGAFGSVYSVSKGDNKYAMKEIAFSSFDSCKTNRQKAEEEEKAAKAVEEKKSSKLRKEESKESKFIDSDEQIRSEICKEVSILKELHHPNIIKYYTSFREGEQMFIIMQLVDGMSLSDFILSLAEKVNTIIFISL
jgi:NIMA (never in mitosis gene a)-related kinase 10